MNSKKMSGGDGRTALTDELSLLRPQSTEATFEPSTDLKNLLQKLLCDQLDHFEILNHAERLSLNLDKVEGFSKQKYAVQKTVLEQILKGEEENPDYYYGILEETNQHLDRGTSKQYLCCLVGCLFRTAKHRNYLQHFKKIHSTHHDLVCNFKHNCARNVSSLKLLLEHVKEIHSSQQSAQSTTLPEAVVDIHCKCDMASCEGKNFHNVEKLMSHFNIFHLEHERQCIFEDCLIRFKKGSACRNHFNLKHKKVNLIG